MIPQHLIDKAAPAMYERMRKDNWKSGYGSGTPWEDLSRDDQYPYRRVASRALEAVAADMWDEGYRAGFSDGPYICACNAWNEGECACGNYGNGETPEPNPYRATEEA